MRNAEISRETAETKIAARLNIDGAGERDISTGIGFFDHMLDLFAAHGRFDLYFRCEGDTRVDFHHTVEDAGIALGAAFLRAAADCRGIRRYGDIILPMDDALVVCVVDFGARAYVSLDLGELPPKVGDFDTELVAEFMRAFAYNARSTVHIRKLAGANTHHIIEAAFKAFARALREALSIDPSAPNDVPSTKGAMA